MASKKKAPRGFKPETIAKIVAALRVALAMYLDMLKAGKLLEICISLGNSKIGRVMNVSLAPILTCGNCALCMFWCYDVKACLQYENVRNARAKNTAIFQHSRDMFFEQLWTKMSRRRRNKFLRFHVSGEIVDRDHFERIVKTAVMFPDFRIWTYTKMYDVINDYIREHGGTKECLPENLSVMFSRWNGLPMNNPYNMPEFWCCDEGETLPAGMYRCPGNCDVCKGCKRGCIYGESSGTDKH